MKEYTFNILTTGYLEVTVDANSEEEAKKKALEIWTEADFGELEDADCEIGDAQ